MEDYHFHCFHASWETEPFPKAGLLGHASSHTLTPSAPQQDNGNTTDERDHHFLETCFQCGRLLGRNKDIFGYRGDPFCSEECRQQEMDADEARERRSKQQPGCHRQEGTEAAAAPARLAPAAHTHRHRGGRATSAADESFATHLASCGVKDEPERAAAPEPSASCSVAAWVFGRRVMPHLQSGELQRAVDASQTLVSLDPKDL